MTAREAFISLARERGLTYYDVDPDRPWQNAAKTITEDDALVVKVDSIADLQAIYTVAANRRTQFSEIVHTRAVAGQNDEKGLFADQCCYGLGGFLKRSNPISKAPLKSYSYAPKTSTDLIIEFSEKFYKSTNKLRLNRPAFGDAEDSATATIPAGLTIQEALSRLAKKGYTLPIAVANGQRSVVGCVVNGVDALEQFVTHISYIAHNGEIEELDDTDPTFKDKLVKFRLLGVITHLDMKVVPNVKLKQQVGWANDVINLQNGFELGGKKTTFKQALESHDSVRVNITPTYRQTPSEGSTGIPIKNIQVIAEDVTTEHRTNKDKNKLIDEVIEHFGKKATRYSTDKLYDLLYKKDLSYLVRAFQMLVAAVHHAERGTDTIIDYKSQLAGAMKKHPIDILKSTVYIPIPESRIAGHTLFLLDGINKKLVENYARDPKNPLTPINFLSAKIIDGSNGALSNTKVEAGQKILAIELNGNRHALGFDFILSQISEFLSENNYHHHFDLSQLMPGGSVYFSASKEGADKMLGFIKDSYGQNGLEESPFVPKEYRELLNDLSASTSMDEVVSLMPELQVQPEQPFSHDEMIELLQKLLDMAVALTKHFVEDTNPEVTAALAYFEDVMRQAIRLYEAYKDPSLPEGEPVSAMI